MKTHDSCFSLICDPETGRRNNVFYCRSKGDHCRQGHGCLFRAGAYDTEGKKINPIVKAEFITKILPNEWRWAVFTGIGEAMDLIKRLKITVRAMHEGSVFYPYEPVMEIEGRYQDFCVYETALLGLICQASGISTQAARMKKLAGERLVMS